MQSKAKHACAPRAKNMPTPLGQHVHPSKWRFTSSAWRLQLGQGGNQPQKRDVGELADLARPEDLDILLRLSTLVQHRLLALLVVHEPSKVLALEVDRPALAGAEWVAHHRDVLLVEAQGPEDLHALHVLLVRKAHVRHASFGLVLAAAELAAIQEGLSLVLQVHGNKAVGLHLRKPCDLLDLVVQMETGALEDDLAVDLGAVLELHG
mmetsp:Transcript_65537/g.174583  ORF Transcript_65537/g.174583 Transcript_65537/m.174583 type:complete len:208 (-) Transcript_65537:1101-1724(-)